MAKELVDLLLRGSGPEGRIGCGNSGSRVIKGLFPWTLAGSLSGRFDRLCVSCQSNYIPDQVLILCTWFSCRETCRFCAVFFLQLRKVSLEREERNVFIGNSTSWITNIQGAKYKIQVNSNRHISYLMYKYHKHQPCLFNTQFT